MIDTQPTTSLWRRPYTLLAIIYLVANGVRFMLIKDFSEWDHVFVLAGRHLRDGIDIYWTAPEAKNHAYSYPPFLSLFALPFTYLPRYAARSLWYLINAVCLVLLWRWSWEASGDGALQSPGVPWRRHVIVILGLLCTMRFVQDNLEHQQTDLLIGALILGGCIAWQRARDLAAATCFGLAAAMKGPPLLFAPYLLWRGKWRAAIWMIIVAIGVNFLPDLAHRAPHGIWLGRWYDEMIKPMGEIGVWHSDVILNQALAGAARRFFATTWFIKNGELVTIDRVGVISARHLKWLVYAVELLLLGISALVIRYPFVRPKEHDASPPRGALECSIVILLMLLMSPMSSKPHFCVMMLPAFCVARRAVEQRDSIARTAIIICIVCVVILDRNFLGRAGGDAALWFGSITAATVALWIACIAGLLAPPKTAAAAPAMMLMPGD